jgi:hypothetical protein
MFKLLKDFFCWSSRKRICQSSSNHRVSCCTILILMFLVYCISLHLQRNLIPCWWKSRNSLLKYFGTKNSFHQNLSSKHHNQSEELENQSFSSSTTSSMSLFSPDVQKYNLHPINQLRNGRYKEQQLDHVHNDLLKRCGSLDLFFDHCLKKDNDSFIWIH